MDMECSRRKKIHGCGSLQLVAKALTRDSLALHTPHPSPLTIILSTLPNFLIPKIKDKVIIWHWQQHVHGTSFINVPTCMSAVAVWFENIFFFGIITFFSLEVYEREFTQNLKGKNFLFLAFDIHLIKIYFNYKCKVFIQRQVSKLTLHFRIKIHYFKYLIKKY